MLRAALVAILLVLAPATAAPAATFTVTSNNDVNDGTCAAHCSLREAITLANGSVVVGTRDRIAFASTMVITPATALPTITDDVLIDGTDGTECNGTPVLVAIDGDTAAFDGLTLGAGSDASRICRIGVRGFANGIRVEAPSSQIDGCWIGLSGTGEAADANSQSGISLDDAPSTVIGGLIGSSGNVVSGNGGDGIDVGGDSFSVTIQGNLIGTDKDGTDAVPNAGDGVHVNTTALGTAVGSNAPIARNIISGNQGSGVRAGAGQVAGNYIGLDITGMVPVPNGTGVTVNGPALIGGTSLANERNVIAANGSVDVTVTAGATVENNWIGLKADGTAVDASDLSNNGINVSGDNARVGPDNVILTQGTGVLVLAGASGLDVTDNRMGLELDGVTPGALTAGVDVQTGADVIEVTQNTIANADTTGVTVDGDDVVVKGNVVGLDAAGATAPNHIGVLVDEAAEGVAIGGASAGEANVVSGNASTGIRLMPGSSGVVVEGNRIGVGADGTTPRANGGDGIWDIESVEPVVRGNTIAGNADSGIRTEAQQGVIEDNAIRVNGDDGIAVVVPAQDVDLRRNLLSDNSGIGIDHLDDGVTANGAGAPQDFPLLTSARSDAAATLVAGTVEATPGAPVRVEFFSSDTCNASAEVFLGAVTVTAGSGPTAFSASVASTAVGRIVTATATDTETSELSACRTVEAVTAPVDTTTSTTTTTTTATTTGGGGPAPAPPPPVVAPPVPSVPPVPRFPAKIRVLRNGVDDGVLDMLIEITSRAVIPGAVLSIDYESSGRHTRFTVPVTSTQVKVRRTLPSSQPKDTGITTVTYAGNSVVGPDDVRLRAADGRSRLVRTVSSLASGRLRVEGTVASSARGVVRIRLGHDRPDGSTAFLSWNAPVDDGAWALSQTLPAGVVAGQLSIQFTGYEEANLRGEQTAKAVP